MSKIFVINKTIITNQIFNYSNITKVGYINNLNTNISLDIDFNIDINLNIHIKINTILISTNLY